jgi:hypothetical protein
MITRNPENKAALVWPGRCVLALFTFTHAM